MLRIARMGHPVLFALCVLVVFAVPSADGKETSESELWDAIIGLAPTYDMFMIIGHNITEQRRTTAAALEKVQDLVVSQKITDLYTQFRIEKRTSLITYREAACCACGYSLGFLVAACIDCIHPPR
ncbi:hypothetical protein Mapa_002519 [Marchantia paleacea]|nr:hypothetical protein Mapa_002519 [Marchantia paleacea]